MEIKIHRSLNQTRMAGPGLRYCLWVQGCSRHCPGCMVPETWPFNQGMLLDTDEIAKKIDNSKMIEGITILGGEPIEQAEPVYDLVQQVKPLNLSVTLFTGYTYPELLAMNDTVINHLLDSIDLLIDGPFRQDLFDLSRPWVGSLNQQYRFLTNRYDENDLKDVHNQIEARVFPDGKVLINGMGDFEKLKKIF